jgi:hypothetical protein
MERTITILTWTLSARRVSLSLFLTVPIRKRIPSYTTQWQT